MGAGTVIAEVLLIVNIAELSIFISAVLLDQVISMEGSLGVMQTSPVSSMKKGWPNFVCRSYVARYASHIIV